MKTMVSVIIPTLGREALYQLIDSLLKQKTNFKYEIFLIPQSPLKENLLEDKRINIHQEPIGKGFSHYRNVGIKMSKGDIIVFIDDDELPIDENWLNNIVSPIIKNKENVVTSGIMIELGQGYLTDSISLLGFPGGGAIGFKTMWQVDKNNYTTHLCSGNIAISREVIFKAGNFSNDFKYGNEDVVLADKLRDEKIKIKYVKEATVYHIARKGLINFIKWNFLRGKSIAGYMTEAKKGDKLSNRIISSLKILSKVSRTTPIYLPGVLFMMFNQYLWQTAGFIYIRLKNEK